MRPGRAGILVRWCIVAMAIGLLGLQALFASPLRSGGAATRQRVDVALVLAVDVSSSVNAERFRLQMDGIAKAFEDPEVQQTILSGPNGAIAVLLVQWANLPYQTLPWTLLTTPESANVFAAGIRAVSRIPGDFTCMATALKFIDERTLPLLPVTAARVVVDVSGDGRDNCNARQPVSAARDALVESGVTINGLPILFGDEAGTLERYYKDNVIGGLSAFTIPANGYGDFQRAIREKFLTELISEVRPPKRAAALAE